MSDDTKDGLNNLELSATKMQPFKHSQRTRPSRAIMREAFPKLI